MLRARPRQSGLSLLEFTLVTLIIAALIVLAFQHIAATRVDRERAAIKQTVAAVRSALALQLAERIVAREPGGARDYAGTNALAYLSPRPLPDAAPRKSTAARPPPGSWYFETDKGTVAYRPRYPEALGTDGVLRWRVEPEYAGPEGGRLTALTFRPLGPHHWQ